MKVGDELEQRFEAIHGTPVWIVAIRFSKVSERPRKLSHRYKWRSISESNEIMSRMSPLVGVRHLFVTLPIWHFLHPIHLSNPNEMKFFDAGTAVWSSIKSKTNNCCMSPLYTRYSHCFNSTAYSVSNNILRGLIWPLWYLQLRIESLLSIIIIWSRRFAFVCWWPWWVGRWRLFRPWSILHRHAAQRHLCCSYIPNRQRNLRHVPMNAIVSNHPKSHPIVAVRTVVRPLRSWPNRHHHQFVTNAAVTRPKLVPWLGVDAWFLEARPTDVVRVKGGVNHQYVKQQRIIKDQTNKISFYASFIYR